MNNLNGTQPNANGDEVAANDASQPVVESSNAMIPPPAGADLQNPSEDEDHELWDWLSNVRLEDFDVDGLPTGQKPEEAASNNATDLPQEVVNSNAPNNAPGLPQEVVNSNAPINNAPDLPQEVVNSNAPNINTLTDQKPEEMGNNAQDLPPEAVNSNAPKINTLSPELRSLIQWQAENAAGPAVAKTAALGQAQGTSGGGINIVNPTAALGQAQGTSGSGINVVNPVAAGDATVNNRKRKQIEVDDNYESNARVLRRGGSSRAHQAGDYAAPGKRSSYSINDKLMALQMLVPGSKKADMATTLGETVEYLSQVRLRELALQDEIKRLKQMVNMVAGVQQGVQTYMQIPMGTQVNMGGNTQLGGMQFRPMVHPTTNVFNSPMSARMHNPSVMPLSLQSNSVAGTSRFLQPNSGAGTSRLLRPNSAAASRLMQPSSRLLRLNSPAAGQRSLLRSNLPEAAESTLLQSNAPPAASGLFMPPQVSGPSHQQTVVQQKELCMLNQAVMIAGSTQENVPSTTGDAKIPENK